MAPCRTARVSGPSTQTVSPPCRRIASDEVRGREVVVARHRDQRSVEVVGHRLDETGLATAGRALQQDGQPLAVGGPEDLFLVADRHVVRPHACGHVVLLPISSRSTERSRRTNARRWASADRTAERNSGAMTPGSNSDLGIIACADEPISVVELFQGYIGQPHQGFPGRAAKNHFKRNESVGIPPW